jgi:D-lactate dehydrogenase (cytochrome)
MVRPHSSVLRGALRTIQSRPSTGISQQRLFAASARCRANEKQQASFKSQLYESTQQRLKRERAEQERFAQYQTQSSGGRYAAMMFGMTTNLENPGIHVQFGQRLDLVANLLCRN